MLGDGCLGRRLGLEVLSVLSAYRRTLSLPFFIGIRYLMARDPSRFISVIAVASLCGIALGVMALILVLSVMNGFDRELKQRVLGLWPHVRVEAQAQWLPQWQDLQQRSEVKAGMPSVVGQGLVSYQGRLHGVQMTGIVPQQMQSFAPLAEYMIAGELDELRAGRYQIVIGEGLARRFGVWLGDKVTLVLPQVNVTPAGLIPRMKRFTVAGIFRVGYDFDEHLTYIHLHDAQTLYRLGEGISEIQLKVENLYRAPQLAQAWQAEMPELLVGDWSQDYGEFFKAVKMEKHAVSAMLLLIIAVASFNLISILLMQITKKQGDIAILRTLGAGRGTILAIFACQGLILGVAGCGLGLLLGVPLAMHLTELNQWFEQLTQRQLLASDVYYIDYLPSLLLWSDVVWVVMVSLCLALLASLYPAWRGANTEIVPALHAK